jgi:hypothetical protein
MNILPYLLCCHCIGDGVLQNHWMQRKAVDSWVCTVHVLAYSAPFLAFATWLGHQVHLNCIGSCSS